MNIKLTLTAFLSITISIVNAQAVQYTTTADGKLKFKETSLKIVSIPSNTIDTSNTILFNANNKYQTMEGFGFALTGGSANLIDQLTVAKKNQLLNEIFGSGKNNLGVSYIRVSIGASDLDAHVFSYDDLPAGQTDSLLNHFNLSEDTLHLIPILKKAIAINPRLKIIASPWSPPIWMKTNGASMGGHLLEKYYASYANYFVKYIQSMKQKGININAITLQNEPEHGGNNPSLLMDATEQATFLAKYVGPQLKVAHLNTEVILFDHNADHPNYPIAVLNNAAAKQYAAGSAFHLYSVGVESGPLFLKLLIQFLLDSRLG